ncbi:MAG: hypothetical protein PQJ59_15825 [Spirochaetales bacterium]|nr:hypothetical protein [Spirochaetales bacterium]
MNIISRVNNFHERLSLFLTAATICIADYFVTTMHQYEGYWAGIYSMVREGNKFLHHFMGMSHFSLIIICLGYLTLVLVLSMILPIKLSKILCFTVILSNTGGFISWLWYNYPRFFAVIGFILLATLIVLLNNKRKNYIVEKVISLILVTVLIFTIAFISYKRNTGDLNSLLKQPSQIVENTTNRELLFENPFFEFRKLNRDKYTENDWPLLVTDNESFYFDFYIPIDLYLTTFEDNSNDNLLKLDTKIQDILSNKENFKIGSTYFNSYPTDSNNPLPVKTKLQNENQDFSLNEKKSKIRYIVQYALNDETDEYDLIEGFFYYDIYTNTGDLIVRRLRLSFVDENYNFLKSTITDTGE